MISLRTASALAFTLAAGALAACGGNNVPQYVYPTPGPTCSPGENVQMVYPIPGATAVPDSPQQIVFAVASPLPSSWNLVINTAATLSGGAPAQTYAGFQTITAAQVPAPAATPTIANPVYQSVTLAGSLAKSTGYWVWVNNAATACAPLGPVGNFTTQ
jgi:hypothetical protein